MNLHLIKDHKLRVFIGIWWQEQQHLLSNGLKQTSVRTKKEIVESTGFVLLNEINDNLAESGFLIKPYAVKSARGSWITIPNKYSLSA